MEAIWKNIWNQSMCLRQSLLFKQTIRNRHHSLSEKGFDDNSNKAHRIIQQHQHHLPISDYLVCLRSGHWSWFCAESLHDGDYGSCFLSSCATCNSHCPTNFGRAAKFLNKPFNHEEDSRGILQPLYKTGS